jgi:hypothetical protein
MKIRTKLLIGVALATIAAPALADLNYTQGSGTVIFAFTCFTSKQCPAHVNVNSSGTEIGTSGSPEFVSVTNTNANGRATAANSSPVVAPAEASTAGAIVPNNTTAVVVKASAGVLFGVQLASINAAPAYLKLYNATSATCGSGTPIKRLMIPAASTAANGNTRDVSFGAGGLAFSTGITYCVTTGIADADTTAPTAANFLVNVDYE